MKLGKAFFFLCIKRYLLENVPNKGRRFKFARNITHSKKQTVSFWFWFLTAHSEAGILVEVSETICMNKDGRDLVL